MLLGLILTVGLLSAGLTAWFARPGHPLSLLAEPNARSLHQQPIPQTGGLAVLLSLFPATAYWYAIADSNTVPLVWILSALLLGLISLWDDWRSLGALSRLLAHFGLAALMLWGDDLLLRSLSLPGWEWHWPGAVAALFSLLFVVWMINLYNFMDGMDGFAGGMAVIGFSGLGLLGLWQDAVVFAGLNFMVVAACLGFLLFNFPPARIFMGDTGASLLGFLAAVFSLWGARDGLFPFWLAVLLFSPFSVDATVTLLRRLLRREKVWQAHKTHYYQRLVQLGWGHRKTVLWEYALMLSCAASCALALVLPVSGQWLLLLAWILIYFSAARFVTRLEQQTRD